MIFSLSNNRLKKKNLNFIFMQPLSQQTLISADILLSHIAHITHFSPHVLYLYLFTSLYIPHSSLLWTLTPSEILHLEPNHYSTPIQDTPPPSPCSHVRSRYHLQTPQFMQIPV